MIPILIKKQNPFRNIPTHIAFDVEEDLLEMYEIEANRAIPLAEDLVKHLLMYIFQYAKYTVSGENETLDDFVNLGLQQFLNALNDKEFHDAYISFVQDIHYYLKTQGYFYESNWLYETLPVCYEWTFANSPLQNVW